MKLSLRTLTVLAVGPGAVLGMTVSLVLGVTLARKARLEELKVRGRSLAYALSVLDEATAFAPSGEERAQEMMRRLVALEDIAFAVLSRPDGTVVASQRAPAWRNLDPGLSEPEGRADGAEAQEPMPLDTPGGDRLWSFTKVVRGERGEPVGRITFGLSQRSQSERFPGSGMAMVLAAVPLVILLLVAWLVLGRLLRPLDKVLGVLRRLEAGDLAVDLSFESRAAELSALRDALSGMVRSLRTIAERSQSIAVEIGRATTEVTIAVQSQAQSAGEVAASISETGATVRGLAQASSQAAEHAQTVIEMAGRSEEFSRSGLAAVEESVGEMRAVQERVLAIAGNITDLTERMQQIGDIIATVTELAERSNLLALNAAIEAAKAGPQGRGFAVVAAEMRNLAEGSKSAAAQVRNIIADIQKAMRAVVEVTEEGSARAAAGGAVAERTGQDIRRLVEAIRESSMAAKQIAAMAKQQNLGIESVAASVTEIQEAIARVLGGIRDLEATSRRLRELNEEASVIVRRYTPPPAADAAGEPRKAA